MTKVVKQEGILAKVESTPGTDAVPDAANNSVFVENISWSFAGARMNERSGVKSTFGRLKPIFGGTLMEVSFDTEVKGSGAAGTAPEIGVLFRGCGCGETVVASTSVTYAGVSTGHEYLTLYFYEDGSLYKLLGCQGTWEFVGEAGGICKITWTFTGHLVFPVDAALPTFVYDSAVPPAFLSAGFSTGGFSSVINALSFSIGNEIATPPSANASDGYGQIHIADRDYTGSFDPEATLVADDDPIGDWKDGTAKAIQTGVIGSAGNRFQLVIGEAYYTGPGPGDRDGVRTYELPFMAANDDSAFSLAFT